LKLFPGINVIRVEKETLCRRAIATSWRGENRRSNDYELLVCQDGSEGRKGHRIKPGFHGRVPSNAVVADQWTVVWMERYVAAHHQYGFKHRSHAHAILTQNTQNRDSAALQLKVDELLRAVRGAQNAFINLEELTEEDPARIKGRYAKLAENARAVPAAL
jgi:hypothetical protein